MVSPLGTAAVSKHETGTVTKQTTGALLFMVAFALPREGLATYTQICLTSLCPGRRELRPRTSTPLTYTITSKINQGTKPAGRDCHRIGALGGEEKCYSAFELLLGTWPSACYQRVDVLSQLLDIYSAFQLLLGTWPSACYQRVEVLSQLLDSPLHVGLSCCYFAFELLLGTWPSACYQCVDVLSQLLDIYSAFQLLLGTWPSACYQRVDVLSQLLDSPLHHDVQQETSYIQQ